MCIVYYTVHQPYRCIHIHRSPTLCKTYSTLQAQQPGPNLDHGLKSSHQTEDDLFRQHPKPFKFEPKVITFDPALSGLVLQRDHIHFQSHTAGILVRPNGLSCPSTVEVFEELSTNPESPTARVNRNKAYCVESLGVDGSRPLCYSNRDG